MFVVGIQGNEFFFALAFVYFFFQPGEGEEEGEGEDEGENEGDGERAFLVKLGKFFSLCRCVFALFNSFLNSNLGRILIFS